MAYRQFSSRFPNLEAFGLAEIEVLAILIPSDCLPAPPQGNV
jgi:hypothetical protein